MNFALDEDHLALRQSAATFLDREIDLSPLQRPGATVADVPYTANAAKVAEMGWQGIVIPEAYGGLGLSCVELAMVLGEMGRTLAPSPFLGTVMGSWAVLRLGTEAQKQKLLPDVAAGKLKLALPVADSNGDVDGARDAAAEPRGDGTALSGTRSFAIDAEDADLLIVSARDKRTGARGFHLVDAKSDGIAIDVAPWRDITRKVCEVRLNGAYGEPMGSATDADWAWVKDRIAFALAAECAGGIQHVLSATAEYAKERVAFGKPIGAYQAIKHALADMLGQAECANVAVLYAAWALSENAPQGPLAAAMSKAYTADAYLACARRSIQIFGAIGFTWEMKNHLYLKRAQANAELFGSARAHRSRVLELAESAA
jgi:alkylation response protein AidB-like acyl-CoA dehydrogenase